MYCELRKASNIKRKNQRTGLSYRWRYEQKKKKLVPMFWTQTTTAYGLFSSSARTFKYPSTSLRKTYRNEKTKIFFVITVIIYLYWSFVDPFQNIVCILYCILIFRICFCLFFIINFSGFLFFLALLSTFNINFPISEISFVAAHSCI